MASIFNSKSIINFVQTPPTGLMIVEKIYQHYAFNVYLIVHLFKIMKKIIYFGLLFSISTLLAQKSQPGQDTHPVWSPNGKKIAFISNRVGVKNDNPINFEIYIMDANGSNQVRLTHNTVFEADITWSPDGSKLAFKSYRDGNAEIYVMNVDGSEQINISNSHLFNCNDCKCSRKMHYANHVW